MKFYSLMIMQNPDGTEVQDLQSWKTLDEATVKFHSDLSNAIGKCENVLCMVLDFAGIIYHNETWHQTIENITQETI